MGKYEFSVRDYRLKKMVEARTRFYRDGIVRVESSSDNVRVFCYDRQIFNYRIGDGFFEATTRGVQHLWMRDKLNACLSAMRIPVRVFENQFGRLRIITNNGFEGNAYRFNSKVLEIKP